MDLQQFRNIGIIAHIDAGKTTVTERILWYTGKEHRIGEVDDGTAAMDWMAEEKERGITITSAATTVNWNGHRINIIDTPGHVDFTCEVERSLRALDGVVGVFDGCAGVEAQSETVWRQADHYRIPRLAFINKLDKTGADFDAAVGTLVSRLGARPVILCLPVGVEKAFSGVIDVLSGECLRFDEADAGRTVRREPAPEAYRARIEEERERICEAACEHSEELMARYLDGGPLARGAIEAGLRRAVLQGDVLPVFCGAARRNKGVQPLLDGICALLPSPLDRGDVVGRSLDGTREVRRRPDPAEYFAALVFKIQFDKHGELIFTRVYSGEVKRGQQIHVTGCGRRARVGKIFLMHAHERVELEKTSAGEIVVLRGIRESVTGDTLCDPRHPVVLEGIAFPETVVSQAIEPRSATDRDRLMECLALLAREDPTFTWKVDEGTGQMIVNGMGELHLEVLVHRLVAEWKLRVSVGTPRVWYRQTIARAAVAACTFEKELGNRRHWAQVTVQVAPDGEAPRPRVELKLDPRRVPREFWPSIEEGVRSGVEGGGSLGFPWIHLRAAVTDGEVRLGDATPVAFAAAAQQAFAQAVEKAGQVILEPIMRFDITVPLEYYGPVSSDLTRRRGEIQKTAIQAGIQRVEGRIPLAETFGYTSMLRSLTQGRGAITLEPCGFSPAPPEVSRRLAF